MSALDIAALRAALTPVVDMHAEKFTPGRPTNRDRLVQVCVAHLGALLDEHEAMRARCDALTIENGRLERGARDAVELAMSRTAPETYAKQVDEIERLRAALVEALGIGELLTAKLRDEDDADFDDFDMRRMYGERADAEHARLRAVAGGK